MKKWLVLVVTMLSLCTLMTSALAVNFDITPFENSENYRIELDDMDDTGSIALVEGGTVIGTPIEGEEDEGLMAGTINVRILGEDYAPFLTLLLIYYGDESINTDRVILKPDDTRYTFKPYLMNEEKDGSILEGAALMMTDESIKMLEEIVDKRITTVRCRFNGDRDVDFNLIFDVEKIGALLEDYKASGALDNDFSVMNLLYPCTIK